MAKCVKCGEELDGKAKFCLICGTPVEEKIEAVDLPDPFETVVKDAPAYGVVNLEQLPEGHLIDDRYEVKGKLGQGGFGAVYRVFDQKMECEKALKVLPEAVASDRAAMVGLKKEAVTMAKLNHPGIVHVYDFCDTGSIKYIDMEFVAGASLSEALVDAPGGRFDEERVKDLARQLAEGLAYAHTQGVIHKDIKPQNILITKNGTPKITDFGISETVKSSMSRIANSSSSGTLVYMAPEQIRGRDVGRESDIYSFGVLLYELLSGHPPFYKGAIEHQILNEAVPPLEGVSEVLERLVHRCLEKEYTRRFRDFEEVLQALEGQYVPDKADSPSLHNAAPSKNPQVSQEEKRFMNRGLTWAVGAVCAVIVVMGALALGSDDNGGESGRTPTSVATTRKHDTASILPVLEKSLSKKIDNIRVKVGDLEGRIASMKTRLDAGTPANGDSMSAMLGLIKEKTEASQTLAGFEQEQRDEAAQKVREAREAEYNNLKHEIDVYEALIATEEGRSLKEAAWNELMEKFHDEARGVAAYDSEALLDGGRLTVQVTPEGATVKVLNIEPIYIPGMKLKPGTYEVEVARGGYLTSRKSVALAQAEEKEVAVVLKAMPTLTLDTVPTGARVILKGTPATYTSGMKLKPGTYNAVVSAKHYISRELEIRLAAGETKHEKVALVPSGRLTIDTSPAGASVVLMGIKKTYSPGMQLAPGEYRILVKAKDYFSKEALVRLVAGKTTSVEMSLQKKKMSNSLGMQFVYIKPGTFMMGSPSGESGRDSDETQHRVTLSKGYYLQTTEVTQGQWKAVMGSNPSLFKNCGDECPVENVSWEDAQTFIRKLNTREGGSHYRLPTEAEWEVGCRGGSETPYANGKSLSSLGWYDDNSGNKTHPVAQKRSNAWGLYDMHGNVYEWCQDWSADYPSGNVTDPVGPSSGSRRVERGGSWGSRARSCRSANRSSVSLGSRSVDVGFRLARTP
ncbi:bifunctional serine/threonine-protein kinase/formylglycine-generating enzyme family protein [Desulfoluna sp.]|uniref:bifunctional serine/threonine-protein kinase/formylglycine-generating enzyme family protein n=1 Tax=Desulfoluna sp. TaxID=2045199 RepID=UPI00262B07FC|nr:bifunctional serine/threonine-protein kinase/formylglycine-generating enzyme family protein [Desulfoluna sp.]